MELTPSTWCTAAPQGSICHKLHHNPAFSAPEENKHNIQPLLWDVPQNTRENMKRMVLSMTGVGDSIAYFWSYKVSRVAGRHQKPILCPQLLGESKVTNPDGLWVAQFIHIQNIAGLQISVHDLKTNCSRQVTHLTLV